MFNASPADVAQLLTKIQSGALQRDWSAIWGNEEKSQAVQDNLDSLIYFSTLVNPMKNIDELERFVGKLTVGKIVLEFIQEQGGKQDQFITVGRSLDIAIRQMLQESSVAKEAIALLKTNDSFEDLLGEKANMEAANTILLSLAALMVVSDEASAMSEGDGCCSSDSACEDECSEEEA